MVNAFDLLDTSCLSSLMPPFTWYPEPTRRNQSRGAGMRLDSIYISKGLLETFDTSNETLSHICGSDHRPVMTDFYLKDSRVLPPRMLHSQLLFETDENSRNQVQEIAHIIVNLRHQASQDTQELPSLPNLPDSAKPGPDSASVLPELNPPLSALRTIMSRFGTHWDLRPRREA